MTGSDRHRVLAGFTRGRLLDVLRARRDDVGVAELASALGLHPNSVREQLAVLVAAGLVDRTAAAPAGRGRPAWRYRIRETALVPGDPYRALAAVLVDELGRRPDAESAAIGAGVAWGRSLVGAVGDEAAPDRAVDRLVGILDEAGFAPELPERPHGPIGLRHCPFEPLARTDPTVVCGVHLGLMRGALAALDVPIDVLALEPFVAPDLCVAHLGDRVDG